MGLTAFDPLDPAILGAKPTMSHVAARREIRELIDNLRLPVRWSPESPLSEGPATLVTNNPHPIH
jgi:hypothetical protein